MVLFVDQCSKRLMCGCGEAPQNRYYCLEGGLSMCSKLSFPPFKLYIYIYLSYAQDQYDFKLHSWKIWKIAKTSHPVIRTMTLFIVPTYLFFVDLHSFLSYNDWFLSLGREIRVVSYLLENKFLFQIFCLFLVFYFHF